MAATARRITIAADPPATADHLPEWIDVTLYDAHGAVTAVDSTRIARADAATTYTVPAVLDDGTYQLAVVKVAGGYDVPALRKLVTFDGQTSDVRVTLPFAAAATPPADVTRPRAWLSPGLAAAVALVTSFWVGVLALPTKAASGISDQTLTGFIVLAVGLVGVGAGLLIAGRAMTTSIMLLIIGIAVGAIGWSLKAKLDLDDGRRMGIGVGGVAIAALIAGIQKFDTIRATVALPVTVLFIGIVTWPGATTLVGDDLRAEITKWVGVLLSATAVAEGATQAATALAEGKAKAAALAPGSTSGGKVTTRLIPSPEGDTGRDAP